VANKKKLFISGISTDVGKTIASAIITEALEADYWKPIQAGDLDHSDSHFIKSNVKSQKSKIFPNAYQFNTPASPHLAAELDGITIDLKNIIEPNTNNHLVIEGAGGVLVPLNSSNFVIDLIQPDYKVIVVSRHYLGSINHTLLTIEALKNRKINIAGIIFNGNENHATQLKCIGRIEEEPYFDQNVISEYADLFRDNLMAIE
jgi:dethiobiotin synthetase